MIASEPRCRVQRITCGFTSFSLGPRTSNTLDTIHETPTAIFRSVLLPRNSPTSPAALQAIRAPAWRDTCLRSVGRAISDTCFGACQLCGSRRGRSGCFLHINHQSSVAAFVRMRQRLTKEILIPLPRHRIQHKLNLHALLNTSIPKPMHLAPWYSHDLSLSSSDIHAINEEVCSSFQDVELLALRAVPVRSRLQSAVWLRWRLAGCWWEAIDYKVAGRRREEFDLAGAGVKGYGALVGYLCPRWMMGEEREHGGW
jgi:hypothetical protein